MPHKTAATARQFDTARQRVMISTTCIVRRNETVALGPIYGRGTNLAIFIKVLPPLVFEGGCFGRIVKVAVDRATVESLVLKELLPCPDIASPCMRVPCKLRILVLLSLLSAILR